ncbi:cyanophycinase [Blastopirellula marina]|uniref:Cyanophycinase n=1 Tax=Blastopirellula marina TaxID=124 RepID=A0A2S8GPQ3_9BACT|nr:cyanophycinase [Blastopirellula marina]PQO46405.1 cyanophycinase [Blastopirellula marina]
MSTPRIGFLLSLVFVLISFTSLRAEEKPGALIVVGGGGLPKSITERFLELGGGKETRLVVIPTASSKPDSDEVLISRWKKRGAAEVTVLHTTDREVANSEAFVVPLKDATAVWIGGGSQSRLSDAYQGTAVEKELIALVARGGVVAGTSAGAAIQTKVMIAHSNPVPVIATGLDLLPGAIVDQHFLARNRMNRLLNAVQQHPTLVGIGIDEATAIEVHGQECRVLGNSFVVVVRSEGAGKWPNIQSYNKGESFSLAPESEESQ